MVILIWTVISIALFIGTFICYVAIMKMREVQDQIYNLHWPVRWVCYLVLAIGLISDWLLNFIVCTVIFLEWPQEILTTERVRRHKFHSTGWRHNLAVYFCQHWLTPFDKKHCE